MSMPALFSPMTLASPLTSTRKRGGKRQFFYHPLLLIIQARRVCTGMGCFLSFFSVREAAGTWSLVVAPLGHLVGAPIRGCRTQGCCGMVCLKRAAHNGRFFFTTDVMPAPKLGLSLILFLFLMRLFFFSWWENFSRVSGPAIGHVKGSHVSVAKLLIEKRIGPFLCYLVKCLL